jgi:hypothetical protein
VHSETSFFAGGQTQSLAYTYTYLTEYLIRQAHEFVFPCLSTRMLADTNKLQSCGHVKLPT